MSMLERRRVAAVIESVYNVYKLNRCVPVREGSDSDDFQAVPSMQSALHSSALEIIKPYSQPCCIRNG